MEKPEFSRPFPVDKLRDRATTEKIEATEQECTALGERLDIVALNKLSATLDMQRARGGTVVEVAGTIEADVVYTCVVTLEPFESHVTERFTTYFARPDQIPKPEDENVEDESAPESIDADGNIDLGELAAQQLSLALDPHPRKPGAVFVPPKIPGIVAEPEPEKKNPFAVLADYRTKKGGGKSGGKK